MDGGIWATESDAENIGTKTFQGSMSYYFPQTAFHSLMHFVETKLSYVGSTAGGACGFFANMTGLTSNANSVLVVAISAIGGGFLANLPKLLTIIYKKRVDDQTFISQRYQSIIEAFELKAERDEKELVLQIEARHDIQGGFQALLSHSNYLGLLCEKSKQEVPKFASYNITQRNSELDKAIKELRKVK